MKCQILCVSILFFSNLAMAIFPFKDGIFSGVGIRNSTIQEPVNYFVDLVIKGKNIQFQMLAQDPIGNSRTLNHHYHFSDTRTKEGLSVLNVDVIVGGEIRLKGQGTWVCDGQNTCITEWSAQTIYKDLPRIIQVKGVFSLDIHPVTREENLNRTTIMRWESEVPETFITVIYKDKSLWLDEGEGNKEENENNLLSFP